MVILTISLGITLFTGLSYKLHMIEQYRDDTSEMWFLNGQYQMGVQALQSPYDGVTYETLANINKLKEVKDIKSEAGIPVRVLDTDDVKRNDKYYNELNENLVKYHEYPLAGNDGTDQIYKSILYGYNQTALHELKKYVIEGDYNELGLKENEIILSVLRMDDTKQKDNPGAYREGTPLMQYHVGDKICMKYRADFNTQDEKYQILEDRNEKYVYKTYNIVAIVSFGYMYDCERTVYPLLITSENQVKQICPDIHIQMMYIDGKDSLIAKEQEQLER